MSSEIKFLILAAFINIFIGCEIINPEENIPSYIRIDNISLTTNPVNQGSDAHKITDAWFYMDNNLIGIYELPAVFPILSEGNHSFFVRAGIMNNGIASTRIAYPLYKSYANTINLQKTKTISITPTVQYFSDSIITFAWLEDFEFGNSITFLSGDTTTMIDTSEIFEGNRSVAIFLDNNHQFFEGISFNTFIFPDKNGTIYLEINYKCNNSFAVGVLRNGITKIYKLIVQPKNYWNKIYIDLSDLVTSTSTPYNILFKAVKTDSIANANIYMDNIKLIHYN